jgi:alkylation response protein AidB-like acyl-CoA dehydrogenase
LPDRPNSWPALCQFKESVRKFAQENIAPRAAAIDASNHFPRDVDLWRLMGDFNLHGLTAPEEYGGMGLGYMYHCISMEEITRASGAVGLSYGAHSNLCINQLVSRTPVLVAAPPPCLFLPSHAALTTPLGRLLITTTHA